MTEDFPKPRYEPPIMIDLGSMAKGRGACTAGQTDAVDCTAGQGAFNACSQGGSASTAACTAGDSATVACTAGGLVA